MHEQFRFLFGKHVHGFHVSICVLIPLRLEFLAEICCPAPAQMPTRRSETSFVAYVVYAVTKDRFDINAEQTDLCCSSAFDVLPTIAEHISDINFPHAIKDME